MGRSLQKNDEMRDIREDQILSNALKLFAVRGLSATKIVDIARVSNFSQGLVYHYFKSKEKLYTEIIENAFCKLVDACISLENSGLLPHEKIIKAVKALLYSIENSEDAVNNYLLTTMASVSDDIPKETKKVIAHYKTKPYEIMARIFREGQIKKLVVSGNPEVLAGVFWGSIRGLAMNKAVHGKLDVESSAKILLRMFLIDTNISSKEKGDYMENQNISENFLQFPESLTVTDDRTKVTEGEAQKILDQNVSTTGYINFPKKQKKKLVILDYIAKQFKKEKKYTESEVNEILVTMNDDYVTLRRYLIEYGFLDRAPDGSSYWVCG